MNQTEFKEKIIELLSSLDGLVERCCSNSISKNQYFILTEINIHPEGNLHELRLREIESNNKKESFSLEEAISQLFVLYSNLYDINLTVFHALKKSTIIEIRYVLKSHLDESHPCRVSNIEPMYHARLTTPFYLKERDEKFDVNWQHQEWKNWWKQFQWKMGWTKRNVH